MVNRKMNWICGCLFASLLITASVSGQALKVGDTIPGIRLRNVLNLKSQAGSLTDYKGKVIVLDLWNVNCGASVKKFSLLDSLQQEFANDLQVLRITRNTRQELESLFDRSPLAAKSKLPLVYSDTTFIKLFPIVLPHQVWIDRGGVIQAIASAREFTAGNIRSIISNRKFALMPMDYFKNFNPALPLFVQANVAFHDRVREYSFVSNYINGINSRMGFSADPLSGKVIRRAFYNTSIGNLIKLAYGGFDTDNRFGLPSDDRKLIYTGERPDLFTQPLDASENMKWEWENTYCYEVKVSPDRTDKLQEIMQSDVKRYFKLAIAEEMTAVEGLALVVKENTKVKPSAGGLARRSFNQQEKKYLVRNSTTKELIQVLSGLIRNYVIADETDLQISLDLTIGQSGDVENIRAQLNEHGLDLIEKQVRVPMLIIRDVKN